MFERFTDRARRVLVYAQEEARLLNHNFIGTEHLLLGLLAEGEGVAFHALSQLGISLGEMRERITDVIGSEPATTITSPPFTPRAKKVLELSLREALQLGHNYIGTEHMLLGIVREGEGVAAQVLEAAGAPLDTVRSAVIGLLAGRPAEPVLSSAGDGPHCPRCQMSLEDTASYKKVVVADHDETGPVMAFYVLFCTNCGRSIGTVTKPPAAE